MWRCERLTQGGLGSRGEAERICLAELLEVSRSHSIPIDYLDEGLNLEFRL